MNLPATSKTMADFFAEYGKTASTDRAPILKFNKGDWIYGKEGEHTMREGTQFLADVPELIVGWVRWGKDEAGNFRILEEYTGLVCNGYRPPARNEISLTDETLWEVDEQTGKPKDPWQFTNELPLQKHDDGSQFRFITSNKGGIGAVGKLCIAYSKNARKFKDQLPIVAIKADKYRHKNASFGWIKVPVFEIVSWFSMDGNTLASQAPPSLAQICQSIEADEDAPF